MFKVKTRPQRQQKYFPNVNNFSCINCLFWHFSNQWFTAVIFWSGSWGLLRRHQGWVSGNPITSLIFYYSVLVGDKFLWMSTVLERYPVSSIANTPTHVNTNFLCIYTVKKVSDFPVPAGMSLTKRSLARNNLIIPAQGEFG